MAYKNSLLAGTEINCNEKYWSSSSTCDSKTQNNRTKRHYGCTTQQILSCNASYIKRCCGSLASNDNKHTCSSSTRISSPRIYNAVSATALLLLVQLVKLSESSPILDSIQPPTPSKFTFDPRLHTVPDVDVIKGHRWNFNEGTYEAVKKSDSNDNVNSRPSRSANPKCHSSLSKVSKLTNHAYDFLIDGNERVHHHKRHLVGGYTTVEEWGSFFHLIHNRLKSIYCLAGVFEDYEDDLKLTMVAMMMVLQEEMNMIQRPYIPWSSAACSKTIPTPGKSRDVLRRRIVQQLFDIKRRLSQICFSHQ